MLKTVNGGVKPALVCWCVGPVFACSAVPTHPSLQVESVLVYGYLEMGREDAPIERDVRVTLISIDAIPSRASDNSVEALFVQPYGALSNASVRGMRSLGARHWHSCGGGCPPLTLSLASTS